MAGEIVTSWKVFFPVSHIYNYGNSMVVHFLKGFLFCGFSPPQKYFLVICQKKLLFKWPLKFGEFSHSKW